MVFMSINIKKLLLSFLMVLTINLSYAQKAATSHYPWFPFQWLGSKINCKDQSKLAMAIPVSFNDRKGNMLLQFDLGSDATIMYENSLASYYETMEEVKALLPAKLDTGRSSAGILHASLKPLTLKIGPNIKTDAGIFLNYGSKIAKDSLSTGKENLVGSLGADFTKDKVLIIDYAGARMCVLDTLDSHLKKEIDFVDCKLQKGRMLLPLKIADQMKWVLFDTGASLFDLGTTRENWQQLSTTQLPVDSLVAGSWGKKTNFYKGMIKSKVYLGKVQLKNPAAWYSDNPLLEDFYKSEAIFALVGNSLFFEDTVVIDFKNAKFGILKKKRVL
jgi:hypothetical protein